jgi:hypothetical protein
MGNHATCVLAATGGEHGGTQVGGHEGSGRPCSSNYVLCWARVLAASNGRRESREERALVGGGSCNPRSDARPAGRQTSLKMGLRVKTLYPRQAKKRVC